MQELQSFFICEKWNYEEKTFEIKEKDGDDSLIYEVYSGGRYLFTLSPEGKIIFENSEAIDSDLVQFRPLLIRHIKKTLHL